MRPIQIIVADDHPLIRAGIQSVLSKEPQFLVLAEATNNLEVQLLCKKLHPDILLLDIHMPCGEIAGTVEIIKESSPETRIIIVTGYDNDVYVSRLVALGVRGYLLKEEANEALVRAIYAVYQGDTWYSNRVIQKLAYLTDKDQNSAVSTKEVVQVDHPSLTCREIEVLQLIGEGQTNDQIANKLSISERTVRHHVEQILIKLQVPNRIKAVVSALKLGFIKA